MHTRRLDARPAQASDLAAIDALLTHGNRHAFSYPDCETAQGLIEELRAYGLALEQGLSILEQSGRPLGCFGFLFEQTSDERSAFLIGPLLANPEAALMQAALDAAERDASNRKFRRIDSCVSDNGLIAILTERGWRLKGNSLEMMLASEQQADPRWSDPSIRLLGTGDHRLAAVSRVLADAFGWGADAAHRLQAVLDDGYSVACSEQAGEVAGAAIWYGVPPFARIENIAVCEDRRRSGVGSALLQAAIASLRSRGPQDIYLSLDPNNIAAMSLYSRHGFVKTKLTTIYRLQLAPH